MQYVWRLIALAGVVITVLTLIVWALPQGICGSVWWQVTFPGEADELRLLQIDACQSSRADTLVGGIVLLFFAVTLLAVSWVIRWTYAARNPDMWPVQAVYRENSAQYVRKPDGERSPQSNKMDVPGDDRGTSVGVTGSPKL